jgi:hypothetical protein
MFTISIECFGDMSKLYTNNTSCLLTRLEIALCKVKEGEEEKTENKSKFIQLISIDHSLLDLVKETDMAISQMYLSNP